MKRCTIVWVEVVALIADCHAERIPRGLPCRLYVPAREEVPSANRLSRIGVPAQDPGSSPFANRLAPFLVAPSLS